MNENENAAVKPENLRKRLETLEDTQRATLNILEDFDKEKAKLTQLQQAMMNLLEDFDDERRNYQLIQQATLNLLEDMHGDRTRLNETQIALMNMLEDVEVERVKVEQSKTYLEVVNKELEAFTYSVSHDLRAPLRAISGFAEAVIEDYAPRLDDEGKRYLGLIQDNAHNMGRLIDDLLAFSRLGRQELTVTEVNMESLAKEVFDELSAQVTERNIEFTVRSIPPARGDKSLIRQVLANLFSNSIKFTKPREKAIIEFSYLPDMGDGVYYVKDNGVGFDKKYAGKLFGVFQRLHSTAEFEGTGVGLALVYRIISRHGGRVWADGEVDKGAVFYFTMWQGSSE